MIADLIAQIRESLTELDAERSRLVAALQALEDTTKPTPIGARGKPRGHRAGVKCSFEGDA